MNNYLCEYTSRTRKAIDTTRMYAILYSDIERRRKPYDCHGRNTTYTRRSSQNAQMYKCYSQALYTQRDIRSHQGWRSLSSKIRGSRQLHNQERYQEGQQINKASVCWQTTTKFTAVSLPLRAWKLARDKPWKPLLIFSIALTQREVNGCATWARER